MLCSLYQTHLSLILCCYLHTQGIARYLFNPAVTIHRRIEDSSINTSFNTLAGVNFEEEVLVESIFVEVCISFVITQITMLWKCKA